MSTGTHVTSEKKSLVSPAERWLPGAITALLTFLVYLPSLAFQYVYDDVAIIVHNPTIRSWHFLPDYFTHDLWQNVQPATGYYRPLLLLWFRLNFAAFGLHPAWWHFTNIALHALAAILVLFLAWRLTGNRAAALTAALIFALHPVHVETVSWLSDAVDALVTIWFIAAVLCFIRARSGSRAWLAASILSYCGATLTKEPGFMLPAVLFAYVVVFEDAPWLVRLRRALLAVAWFVPFAVIYLVLRYQALHHFSVHAQSMSTGQMLLTLPSVTWSYVRSLFVPVGLSPFYEFAVVSRPTWSEFFAPLLGLLLAALLLLMIAKRMQSGGRKLLAFSLAWIAITVAPALNLSVFPASEMVHDRYIYLASVGFCVALAAMLFPLAVRSSKAVIVPLVVCLCLATLTYQQQGFWQNDATLYTRSVKIAPGNLLAESGLANILARQGHYDDAIKLYQRILQRDPNHLVANLNLGWTYFLIGNYAESEHYLSYAATHYANRADCFFDLGVLYQKTGRLDLALASLRRAQSLSPPHPGIQEKLSEVEEAQGDSLSAIQSMQTAVQLDPANQAYAERLKSLQQAASQNP